jgi:N-methylhydantoinase B
MQHTIDSVTREVIYHRFKSIADEMQTCIQRTGFTTVMKETGDNCAGIFDAQCRMIAQGYGVPFHLASLILNIPEIVKQFPISQMKDGDIYMQNDPYNGGSHLPDIAIVLPVICQGEVAALACAMAHQQDIGAKRPAVCTDTTSLFEEGLNIPPTKYYEAGVRNEAVHRIIMNNVRQPALRVGDLQAQISACKTGRARILELFEEYGKDLVLSAMEQINDYSEALTRQALIQIPDGDYSFVDYIDSDGIDYSKRIKIAAKVTIRGDQIITDFRGSGPQAKGPFNCVPSVSMAAVSFVTRAITGASIPNNEGCFRPITFIPAEEGSILNPRYPAPVGARQTTLHRIKDVLMGALIKVVPERLPACSTALGIHYFVGTDPLIQKDYVGVEFLVGGQGARPTKDGIDTVSTDLTNVKNNPVESIEKTTPIRILKTGLRDGSGGAGEYRGGLGLHKVFELTRGECVVNFFHPRFTTRSWGVFGGLPGAIGKAFIVRKTGEKEEIPSKCVRPLSEGDQLHLFNAGGGGYGDPLKRKPELVLRDVFTRRVSLEAAAEDYGVVIKEKSMAINREKTDKLRKEKARLRGPITWTYDRGPEMGGKE